MLRGRGLSEAEALSVITYALSTGVIVRDPPPAATLRVAGPDGRGRVLVVDDDFDLRQTLEQILGDEGYFVETAANGREALAHLRQSGAPRVLVLDLMMPVMDGWQLLDELKRDPALSAIPVVVISAGKTGLRGRTAQEVLSKPLDYYKLVATIDRSVHGAAVH
jgi:CheY-like chemotaxis protein